MKHLTLKCVAALMCTAAITSCSLDDPTDSDLGSANARVSYLSLSGISVVTYTYDNQGRMTKIDMPLYDFEINLTYEPLTIETKMYDYEYEWSDVKDDYVAKRYLSEYTLFNHFQFNEDGTTKQCTMTEKDKYGIDQEIQTDTYESHYYYNSKSQLTTAVYDDVNGNEYTYFTWDKNDDLVSITDDDGENATFEYSDTENKQAQWSVMWNGLDILLQTGYFGAAPAHLPSAISYDGDNAQFAYKLNSAGYIQKEMVYSEGETLTYTYHYDKATSAASSSSTANIAKRKAPVSIIRKKKEAKK